MIEEQKFKILRKAYKEIYQNMYHPKIAKKIAEFHEFVVNSNAWPTLISRLAGFLSSDLGSSGGLGMQIMETLFLPWRFSGMEAVRMMFSRMLPGKATRGMFSKTI